MSIHVNTDIFPLVEEQQAALIRDYPNHADILDALITDFRSVYGSHEIANMLDLPMFCKELSVNLLTPERIPPELHTPIRRVRTAIAAQLSREYVLRKPPRISDIDPQSTIRYSSDIKRDPHTKGRPRTKEQLTALMLDYISLAAQRGEQAVIDVLISIGRIEKEESNEAISILRTYLGDCSKMPGGGNGPPEGPILALDDQILQDQDVRNVVKRMLEKHIYTYFVYGAGADKDEYHSNMIERAKDESMEVMKHLARNANVDPTRHEGLFTEVATYFDEAAHLPIPTHMVSTIDQYGSPQPAPSWRQRLALMKIQRDRHVLIGFEPGLGKTLVPILHYELQAAERIKQGKSKGSMLYIGPKSVLGEIPNRIRPGTIEGIDVASYYAFEHEAPTVGVIKDGMKFEEFEQALLADIVFCPYTMILEGNGEKGEDKIPVYEWLISRRNIRGEPFTLAVADESHQLRGNGKWTDAVRQIIHDTDKLYDEGNVIFMSGTPAVNTLADIRIIAELLEPNAKKRVPKTRISRTDPSRHPDFMRNMLGRTIILDRPLDWQKYITVQSYELGYNDRSMLEAIKNDSTLKVQEKISISLQIIRGSDKMAEKVREQLEQNLLERNTVLIAENIFAQGITREWNDEDRSDPIFRDKIHEILVERTAKEQMPHNFNVIDGENNKTRKERAKIFKQAKESKETGDSKSIILVQSLCVNEGIDLRFVNRMISLQWHYNSPYMQQLLMRSLRAGNSDIRMDVFYAKDTLEEGMYLYANDKYDDIRACLYEDVTDKRLRRAAGDNSDIESDDRVLAYIHSPEQQRDHIRKLLHGQGMRKYEKFWQRPKYRLRFKEDLELAQKSGLGDSDRYIAGFVKNIEQSGHLRGNSYLHTHSQGLRLATNIGKNNDDVERNIMSCDPHEYMLQAGHMQYRQAACAGDPHVVQGSLASLGHCLKLDTIQAEGMDMVILEGLEYTFARHSEEKPWHERLRSIIYALDALKVGGILSIHIPREACRREEFKKLVDALRLFNCSILPNWTGEGSSTDNEGDNSFKIFTITAKKLGTCDRNILKKSLPTDALQLTHIADWPDSQEKRSIENEKRNRKLPYPLLHENFSIGDNILQNSGHATSRAEQCIHLQTLEYAVSQIRLLAASRNDFLRLTFNNQKDTLRQLNIEYLPQVSSKRLAFRHVAYPQYIFYPYDSQWDS